MTELTAGKRLRSTVSDTEVIVIGAPQTAVELCCGGHPMSAADTTGTATAASGTADDATLLGKRYVDDESGLEVLCTKSGTGALAADGRALAIKAPKGAAGIGLRIGDESTDAAGNGGDRDARPGRRRLNTHPRTRLQRNDLPGTSRPSPWRRRDAA